MGERVAAVDCGTNSIRLLVADRSGAELTDLARRMEIVRLGQGVDRTGRLAPEALERTRKALAGYAREIRELGATRVRMVATSASRDASNAADFRAMVLDTLGVEPEVITGDEEARLSFRGAVGGLPADVARPYLVVDIGGGSTEFVLGGDVSGGDVAGGDVSGGDVSGGDVSGGDVAGGDVSGGDVSGGDLSSGDVSGGDGVTAAVSVDIGCVRMTERHLRSDPPTEAQIAAAEADIRAVVDGALDRTGGRSAASLIGLAGSVTTVAGIALGLDEYDPARIHHSRISLPRVARISADLLAATHERRAAIGVMHPGRVDVIGAGALILRLVMERSGVDEVVVSEHDILDGIALSA